MEADLYISTFGTRDPSHMIVALAGNPNVGKSTLFNAFTGLKQHTGNWSGKTVTNAKGSLTYNDNNYTFIDLPGTYSLMPHSTEEEIARDFILFGHTDATIVVCDATCLERNLNLVLQTMEITKNVIVCINLIDEAQKKGIYIDIQKLEQLLQAPVVATAARNKEGLDILLNRLEDYRSKQTSTHTCNIVKYSPTLEKSITELENDIKIICNGKVNERWVALRLLTSDASIYDLLKQYLNIDIKQISDLNAKATLIRNRISEKNLLTNNQQEPFSIEDIIVDHIIKTAEEISKAVTTYTRKQYDSFDRKLDNIATNKLTGIPVMLILLGLVFWITLTGATIISDWLTHNLLLGQDILSTIFLNLNFPIWLHDILVFGVYRVVAWVVAVMLPPMAIFFPLFTLLEDFGYLPRVAFNLDHHFKKAHSCGKNALTMCMGFGCNAAGVTGCRIIDSPREKLIAILTNSFVPCNGRLPQPHREQQSYHNNLVHS